jgi:hypothetical protein
MERKLKYNNGTFNKSNISVVNNFTSSEYHIIPYAYATTSKRNKSEVIKSHRRN